MVETKNPEKMEIICPENFIEERKYIIDIIFKDFLGLDYNLKFKPTENYIITLENKNQIVFKDSFCNKISESDSYLKIENIPEKVIFAENKFTPEKDIPVLFGNSEIQISENKIECNIDIFASSFFMLTRWEEAVITEKDIHGRFKCENSLAQKFNFHERAIVNEYLEMLWNMLVSLGFEGKKKENKFKIFPTHDIDFLFQFNGIFNGIKEIAGDFLKRKNIKQALFNLKNFVLTKLHIKKDPFDTFDFLMKFSELNNLKSTFYFMPGNKNEFDIKYKYSKKLKKIFEKILNSGHKIGIHGRYNGFNNIEILQKEILNFNKFLSTQKISEIRQHFLRFENPETWKIQNNCNLKTDSTIGYSNTSGFRAGVCFQYNVFDVIERKKLNLIENPLIFMETASQKKYPNPQEFLNHALKLKNTVKKYNGNFLFLWHNSNLNSFDWIKFKDFYEILMKE
jgi:hypothetical protein